MFRLYFAILVKLIPGRPTVADPFGGTKKTGAAEKTKLRWISNNVPAPAKNALFASRYFWSTYA
jgi:hypothetical protein